MKSKSKKNKKIKPIDSDRDGISNIEEKKLGLNPKKRDTDGDGISDLAEIKIYHTNPKKKESRKKIKEIKKKDHDLDGLSDEEELKLGTNPNKPDSDGDGLDDLAETLIYHTDPNKKDTDNDHISDGDEVEYGLDPKKPNHLKDLLIPHSLNNYTPILLTPRYTIISALFFLLAKLSVFIFIMFLPATAFLAPDVLRQQKDKLIAMVGELRENYGIEKLNYSAKLEKSARLKAESMADLNYFSHYGPTGYTIDDFLEKADYDYAIIGENLAMGFVDAEKLMDAWKKSPWHYQNLIDPDFEDMGFGIQAGKYKQYDTTYIAHHFGKIYKKETGSVLGIKIDQEKKGIETIEYNREKSKVFWKYDGKKTTLEAKAYIKGEVISAKTFIDGYSLNLTQSEEEENLYAGKIIIKAPISEFFNIIINPSIEITAGNGDKLIDYIEWYEIKAQHPTFAQKYSHAKNILPANSAFIFNLEKILYGIGIILFAILLIWTMIKDVKKLQTKTYIAALLLLTLLTILLFT